MNEFESEWTSFIRIQGGVRVFLSESERMSLRQIELVWIQSFVQNVSEFNMAEFKMAVIIKLSQNKWVSLLSANGGNQSWQVWVSLRINTKMVESKMVEFKLAE